MPEVSVIIPTYNSARFIDSCLDSIFLQVYQDFETIVIDNGSEDGTADLVKDNYHKVKLIENQENLGAARARNQGIEIAKGNWILTMDCDAILEKDFFKIAIDFTKALDNSIGMVQPRILKTDRKTIYSCGIFLSWLGRFYDIGKGKPDNGKFDKERYIFGSCSAAALYKRQMLEETKEYTGYFDERFFFLAEDVDLAWRAQRNGWKGLYVPEAICYHRGNSSSTNKKLRQFLCWRNRKFMLEKYQLNICKLAVIYLFYDLARTIYLFLFNPLVRKAVLNKNNYSINEVRY